MKYRWCVRTMPKTERIFLFPFPFFRSMIMRLQPADIESRMKYRRDGGKINSRLLFEGTEGNWKYSYNDFYIVSSLSYENSLDIRPTFQVSYL